MKAWSLILLWIAPCVCTVPAAGQQSNLSGGHFAQSFKREITTTVSGRFLLFLPRGFAERAEPLPLIMFLHGAGERGDDLEKVKIHGPPKLVETQPDFPFIVVSPQAERWGGWQPDVLNALLDEVMEKLPVDSDRVYLTGLSMGGFGTWEFAAAYPRRFAAIAPICGGGNPETVCALKDVPVWAFHGALDNVIPLKAQEDMVNALQRCGGNVRFTVYPEAGHDSWTETYLNPDLYRWFLDNPRRQ